MYKKPSLPFGLQAAQDDASGFQLLWRLLNAGRVAPLCVPPMRAPIYALGQRRPVAQCRAGGPPSRNRGGL